MSVIFNQVFHPIQDAYENPKPVDLAALPEILDLMVALERDVLSFTDPKYNLLYNYGTDAPEKLPGKYPTVLHYLGSGGARMSSLMMGGGNLAGHPGGIRDHIYNIDIFIALGAGRELLKDQLNKTLPLLKAWDMAYSANGNLGLPGRVKGVKLIQANAGFLEYANESYFGWLMQAVVQTQFYMEAG